MKGNTEGKTQRKEHRGEPSIHLKLYVRRIHFVLVAKTNVSEGSIRI